MRTTEDLPRQCRGLPVAPGNKDAGDRARLVLLEPSFSVLHQLFSDSRRRSHGFKFSKLLSCGQGGVGETVSVSHFKSSFSARGFSEEEKPGDTVL